MIFSSLEFLIFLPTVLVLFYVLARFGASMADAWLVAASLFFYGWWNPKYLALIITLLIVNYIFGLLVLKYRNKGILAMGVIFNLAVLGYYKYANFFIDNLNAVAETNFHLAYIILPLGISFFTFQKIAYLIDAYRGEVTEHKFLNFSLFVLFFPQLIAGPIVHHKEIIPQFRTPEFRHFKLENLSVGMAIFLIGLFKKLVLADNAATYASPVFEAAANGVELSLTEAWGAAICYTLQLYFDFSGYSDMAIGAARMFGITLPVNFNSPYKSFNIIEFWRRWHMSLSRFLRDYVYIPLGGNRKGETRRYVNLFLTMLLAGIWHGAGWTFVVWGFLHGTYLIINHFWQHISRGLLNNIPGKVFGLLLTFICVVVGWVIFRAENMATAISILESMFGMAGVDNHAKKLTSWDGVKEMIIISLLIIWFMPNTQDLLRNYKPVQRQEENKLLFKKLVWQPNRRWAFFMAVITILSLLSMALMEKSEFLYFDF